MRHEANDGEDHQPGKKRSPAAYQRANDCVPEVNHAGMNKIITFSRDK